MEKAILEALAKDVTAAVKGHVTARLSPVETTLTLLETRVAALEQKLAERGTSDDATRPLRAIK